MNLAQPPYKAPETTELLFDHRDTC